MIEIKNRVPSYEKRTEIECTTLYISMIGTGGKGTFLSAVLDVGLNTEREVRWVHAEDFPVFVFKKTFLSKDNRT